MALPGNGRICCVQPMTAIQPCNDLMDAEPAPPIMQTMPDCMRLTGSRRSGGKRGVMDAANRMTRWIGQARVMSSARGSSRRRRLVHLLLTVLATTWFVSPASAQPVSETAQSCASNDKHASQRILATVTGARRVAGNITFTLYGSRPAAFLAHNGSIAIDRTTLTGVTADACFVVSTPGVYALAVYHDENNNHHFDRSLIGLPLEGYGFSNNAAIFMGPPSFASVRFTVQPGDNHVTIKLRY